MLGKGNSLVIDGKIGSSCKAININEKHLLLEWKLTIFIDWDITSELLLFSLTHKLSFGNRTRRTVRQRRWKNSCRKRYSSNSLHKSLLVLENVSGYPWSEFYEILTAPPTTPSFYTILIFFLFFFCFFFVVFFTFSFCCAIQTQNHFRLRLWTTPSPRHSLWQLETRKKCGMGFKWTHGQTILCVV